MLRHEGLFSSAGRRVILATVAVLVLTTAEPPIASARPVGTVTTGVSAATPSSDATDFSARRRRYVRRGNAAGLAMMGMMIGTFGAIVAQQQREDYYYNGYGPGYYGPGPYYGGRYYRYYPY